MRSVAARTSLSRGHASPGALTSGISLAKTPATSTCPSTVRRTVKPSTTPPVPSSSSSSIRTNSATHCSVLSGDDPSHPKSFHHRKKSTSIKRINASYRRNFPSSSFSFGCSPPDGTAPVFRGTPRRPWRPLGTISFRNPVFTRFF